MPLPLEPHKSISAFLPFFEHEYCLECLMPRRADAQFIFPGGCVFSMRWDLPVSRAASLSCSLHSEIECGWTRRAGTVSLPSNFFYIFVDKDLLLLWTCNDEEGVVKLCGMPAAQVCASERQLLHVGQRHVNGSSACGWRGGHLPPGSPQRSAGRGKRDQCLVSCTCMTACRFESCADVIRRAPICSVPCRLYSQ